MEGYIANTDYDWYRFLSTGQNLDEVNFWQPSGSRQFRRVPPGAPFFFKLKSPHNAIAGFGFFAHFSRLQATLAWEAFGEKNGASSFDEMLKRVVRYRSAPLIQNEDPVIGCLMIGRVSFFPRETWIPQPRDWRPNIVQGAGYDLRAGEGLRVWQECLSRTAEFSKGLTQDQVLREIFEEARFGKPVQVQPRLGQQSFRFAILDAYGRACAVTTEHSLPVIEAAHIKPYDKGGRHEYGNGILLRADVHRLFDRGYVSVDPNYRFRVSPMLREEWNNGETYYHFDGQEIQRPQDPKMWPNKQLLEYHYEEVFRN